MHDYPLITMLAAGFTAAWVLGLITQRFGLSPIVGYLLAGVAIGPHTPGFVGDVSLAPQLAELGVILLMFGVGLHFHAKDLLAVKGIAIPGAIVQSLVATVAGAVIFKAMGWTLTSGLVAGMAMAVASTVVLMRVLMDARQLNSSAGHAAVGWLIVEDLITVVLLVMIPALAGGAIASDDGHGAAAAGGGKPLLISLGIALFKLCVMVVVVLVLGGKVVPWVLVQVARLRSRELFTLTVLVLSIAVAAGTAAFFGASPALGAFLAGMVVAQSPVSQQAGADALPLRDAFAVLFFVSVGMLFDPSFVIEHPELLAGGLVVVLVAKPLAAIAIVAALGYPGRTALTVAIGLAQIGEFSFIVGELAMKHGLLPEEGRSLLVACALVSITLNPLVFRSLDRIEGRLRLWPRVWNLLDGRSDRRAKAGNAAARDKVEEIKGPIAVLVGYGPVGRQLDGLLRKSGIRTVVIDLNMDVVSTLMAEDRVAIYGDATNPEVLAQAGIERASHLVFSSPSSENQLAMVSNAKLLNPMIKILIRAKYVVEEPELRDYGADVTVVDEVESGVALAEAILADRGADAGKIKRESDRVRSELGSRHRPSHA